MDDEIESAFYNANMDGFDSTELDMPSDAAGGVFDDMLAHAANPHSPNPSPRSSKRYQNGQNLNQQSTLAAVSPAESLDNSSRSSASESPLNHLRQASVASTTSAAHSENPLASTRYSEDWMRQDLTSVTEEPSYNAGPSYIMDGSLAMGPDLESSNNAMNASFDFESAASSPSPLTNGTHQQSNPHQSSQAQHWIPSGASAPPSQSAGAPEASFIFGMKEQSSFSGAASSWGAQSPSSLLGESLGGISMNGQSPLNPSLSPHMNMNSPNSFQYPTNVSSSPAQTPMETTNPMQPKLSVHHESAKSRVETQIAITLTISSLPAGVKKLRLPSHTISKLKFLAGPSTEPSPDTLQLSVNLVCTSAMQDPEKFSRALARARGERPQSGSNGAKELRPLDGGDVKICSGCIQRERKRASRKKQRKPEEDELFQKDEDKRVVVFNTNEIKEWTEAAKIGSGSHHDTNGTQLKSMQVELPMRIACYCRHQNEKFGFRVIFTVRDHLDKVLSQAVTKSIMITDDHKTQAPSAPPMGPSPSLPDGSQLPGAAVFSSGTNSLNGRGFASPQSPTDLQGLQQRFSSEHQLTPSSFAHTNGTNGISPTSQTPRNLSRQASPVEFSGPQTKRRKHSSSGRLPSELTMTRMESPHQSSPAASAGVRPAQVAAFGYTSPGERPFVTPAAMSGQYGNGPPTPNQSIDNNPFVNPTPAQRQSLDALAHQSMASAPNSAQASRPGTPGASSRNGYQDQSLDLSLGANPVTAAVWSSLTTPPNRLPPVINKLVPAEGTINGGTEVTLLGSGFYPGMEVVFGDTLATTTTFWADKCLNCLTPPALGPGVVSVVFKHEHPSFSQVQQAPVPRQQHLFRYLDDSELQLYRLALSILGQKLGSTADAYQTAQQIMGNVSGAMFGMQKDMSSGGSSGGHQRQASGHESQERLSDLDSNMSTYLEFVDLGESSRSARWNARNSTGHTLLHIAASLGLTRFVAGLLARGAKPDVQDNAGNSPMHLAALHGHAHIVHRLRLAGANANARSVRGFTPADLATTLATHQAALLPSNHYRSRSAGSLARRRQSSSASLNSLWEVSSTSGSLGHGVEDSSELDEDYEDSEDSEDDLTRSLSRRSSMHQDALPSAAQVVNQPPAPGYVRGFTPPAAFVAWRNQLSGQIHHFQQSVANAFPNIPALPPMPALPDYQANQMMRRITNLVPHRPMARDGWWDMLTGSTGQGQIHTQPPSYDELYPHDQTREEGETELKKTALLHAMTEAALDQHLEARDNTASASTSAVAAVAKQVRGDSDDLKDITIGSKVISREEQKHLRAHQARRMKGLASDRNLYFFWIPLLLLVLGAWTRNYVPGLWDGVAEGFDALKTRATQRVVELGV